MKNIRRLFTISLLIVWSLPSLAVIAGPDEQAPSFSDDVVASVGDQPITFSELNTMLNSSAIVGLSIPELGSPQRDQVRMTLLDKVISANLIYLDALKKGVDQDPGYQADLQRFSDSMLALAYKRRYLSGEFEVSDEEVKEYFDTNIASGTEFTDEVKLAISAKLSKQKSAMRKTATRKQLRQGVKVDINVTELDPGDDAVRNDSDVVAELDGEPIFWGEVKGNLARPVNAVSVERRIDALDKMIDIRVMTRKGQAAGLVSDPGYLASFNQFKKVRLINLHRSNMINKMAPTDDEITAYYEENRDRIMIRERRKLQIVVLKTEEDAEAIKEMLEAGTITMYQAAAEHSILPGSKKSLGEIGWVTEGTGFPELDELTFSLGPNEIGGPVETPNGWHLVKVQDVDEAANADIDNQRTRHMTRRMMIKERLNAYVVVLREETFPVKVYEDKLSYRMQKEVDWYEIKSATGTQPPEKVYQEIDKLRGIKTP